MAAAFSRCRCCSGRALFVPDVHAGGQESARPSRVQFGGVLQGSRGELRMQRRARGRGRVRADMEEIGETRAERERAPGSSSDGSRAPSVRTSLSLLEKLSAEEKPTTIGEQLKQQFEGEPPEEMVVPLGRREKAAASGGLNISQKRNIRRQAMLDRVSRRNDTPLFAGLLALLLLPPAGILAVAVAVGVVDLFP